jgi:hypothetical protein
MSCHVSQNHLDVKLAKPGAGSVTSNQETPCANYDPAFTQSVIYSIRLNLEQKQACRQNNLAAFKVN